MTRRGVTTRVKGLALRVAEESGEKFAVRRTVPGSGEDRWDLRRYRPPRYDREDVLCGVPIAQVEAYLAAAVAADSGV